MSSYDDDRQHIGRTTSHLNDLVRGQRDSKSDKSIKRRTNDGKRLHFVDSTSSEHQSSNPKNH